MPEEPQVRVLLLIVRMGLAKGILVVLQNLEARINTKQMMVGSHQRRIYFAGFLPKDYAGRVRIVISSMSDDDS